MKNITSKLFTILLFIFILSSMRLSSQTASTTIVYTGFQSCGGCTVCGADYYCFNTISSYCGNTAACDTKTFMDPVPPGNIVTAVTINYFSAQCTGGSLAATINGNSVPTVNEGNTGCPCSASPCGQSAGSSNTFPCGLPGYNNGGSNSLQLCTGANVCINRLQIVLTYAPANQASAATQPTSVLGQTNLCPGVATTFSCPAVANAASYDWTVPAGWSINSGQGTSSINATPGSAGNICVRAQNLCGNSAYTCLPVNISTNSTPAASASANPNPVCANATTSNLSLSGGSLGTAASWNWYSGSCGGTFVGSGTSLVVSPTSTTTYFVHAVGSCNTTACASVVVTVNPAPTANAGATKVLNCTTTNTVLSGSGGGSYSWSGPGIVSGGTTSTPTVNQPGTYSLIVTSAGCPSTVSTVVVSQNITPPTGSAAAATGSVLNCTITSLSLNGSPSSGVSYSWSGPGITSGGTTSSPTVNQPGTYNLVVTDNSNGCTNSSSPASVVITQNITTPSASASAAGGSALSCSTTTLVLNGTPSSGVTYNWSGPGIVSGGTTASPTINMAGSYSLVVTDLSNGCSNNSASAVVTISQSTLTISGTASTNSMVTCVSTNVDLNCSPAGYTYTWTAPGGSSISSGTNSQNANGSGGGTYTVTIKDPSTSCMTTATIAIPEDFTAPAGVSAAANGSITCTTATVALSSTPNSGVSYSWTGPGIVSGGTTSSPVVNQAGTYSLIVTNNSNGCSNSSSAATATVTQDVGTPTAIATVSGSLTCGSTSLTLNGNTSATSTYSWTGPGIISGATTTNPDINLQGNYIYNVTNTVSGCSNSTTVTVTQNTTSPSPLIVSTGNNTLTCNTTVLTLTASPASGVTYSWTGPGIVSGGNTANPNVDQPGTYSLTVTDNINNCSNPISVMLTVFQNTTSPTITSSTTGSSSITCAATTVTLSATPASGVSYNWTGPGIVSGATTANPVVNQGGNYSVTVTDNLTGCFNTQGASGSVVNVPVDNTAPVAQINATTAGSVTCTNTMVTIDGSASTTGANITYTWSTSGSGIISGNSGTNMPSITAAGDYTLIVMNSINGCTDTETISIVSNITTPSGVNAGGSVLLPCDTGSVILNGSSTSGNVSYLWNGPNSYSFTGQNTTGVSTAGTYTLTVIDNTNGCSISDTVLVINQSVVAGFTADQNLGVAPLPVNFTNTSVGAGSYSWNFNDGNVSVLINPSNVFQSPGTYTVVMVAFNSAGTCSSVATSVITVEDPFMLEIPNVFTPNGDGANDVFTINSKGVKDITLQIFNRWGEKMYEFSGANAAWDGLNQKGTQVPEATYFYFIKVSGFDDKVVEQQGTLNLFR